MLALLASTIAILGDQLDIPGNEADLRAKIDLYSDPELIKQTIYTHYQEAGRPFIIVQDESEKGELKFRILESKLGKIIVEGNRWSTPASIARWLNAEPGSPISTNQVRDSVQFSNMHPFRKTQAVFAAGDAPLTTDIRLVIDEKRPVQMYSTLDNTGTEHLGRIRWMSGVSWGNALGLGHVLSYQYTTSPNFSTFQAHTLQYTAYCPWRHTISIYGGYSSIHANVPGGMKNSGYSGQGSLRYTIPLSTHRHWTHDIHLGADWKRTNNTLITGGEEEIYSKNVTLFQLSLGYEAKYNQSNTSLFGRIEVCASPGQWLPDQTNRDYYSLRPGATNRWIYGKIHLDALKVLPKNWKLALRFQGQLTGNDLIPSEQLGIGGYQSVRGYEERQLNKEIGAVGSIEFRTPSIKDRLYFLAFVDGGVGRAITPMDPIPNTQYLLSIGPGARVAFASYFQARFDWGYQLARDPLYGGAGSLVHFSCTGSY